MKKITKTALKQIPLMIGYGILVTILLGLYVSAFIVYWPIWIVKNKLFKK